MFLRRPGQDGQLRRGDGRADRQGREERAAPLHGPAQGRGHPPATSRNYGLIPRIVYL